MPPFWLLNSFLSLEMDMFFENVILVPFLGQAVFFGEFNPKPENKKITFLQLVFSKNKNAIIHELKDLPRIRSSRLEVFCEKSVFRNFAKFIGKHLCQSQAYYFIEKETLAHVFSCKFCEISKNNFFHRTPPVVASII